MYFFPSRVCLAWLNMLLDAICAHLGDDRHNGGHPIWRRPGPRRCRRVPEVACVAFERHALETQHMNLLFGQMMGWYDWLNYQ